MGLVPSAWNILRKLSRDSITKFSDQMKYIEFGSAYLAKEEKKVNGVHPNLYKTFLVLAMISFSLGALVNYYTLKKITK